jgi:hypothetical protein
MIGPVLNPHEEREWLFSFGYGHVHPITGESLAGCYVRIRGTVDSSRDRMFAAFGPRWAFQYRTAEELGVEEYGLREIPYPTKEGGDGEAGMSDGGARTDEA